MPGIPVSIITLRLLLLMKQVGRIVDELKKKGMYDNALICFVADHGDMLGDHHLWRKTYAYEGSAAILLL